MWLDEKPGFPSLSLASAAIALECEYADQMQPRGISASQKKHQGYSNEDRTLSRNP